MSIKKEIEAKLVEANDAADGISEERKAEIKQTNNGLFSGLIERANELEILEEMNAKTKTTLNFL